MATMKALFAANLRRILREKDLDGKKFAKLMGASASSVSYLAFG